MENRTFKQYYKDNNLHRVSGIAIAIFITSLSLEIYIESEEWYFTFFFLAIGVVIAPLFGWLDWRNRG